MNPLYLILEHFVNTQMSHLHCRLNLLLKNSPELHIPQSFLYELLPASTNPLAVPQSVLI